MFYRYLSVSLLIVLCAWSTFITTGRNTVNTNNTKLGVKNSMLMPCNGRYNCAITQMVNEQKSNAKPLSYTSSKEEAQALLKKIILSLPRTKIVVETADYLHATFESKWWKFVDDVEFSFSKDKPIIHMRSASRVGKYDFGVNKCRLKKIKRKFENKKFQV